MQIKYIYKSFFVGCKKRMKISIIAGLILGIGVLVNLFHFCQIIDYIKSTEKLIIIVEMIIINFALSFLHELGHVFFANPQYVLCSSICIGNRKNIPFIYTEYSMKGNKYSKKEILYFYLGGCIMDALVFGVSNLFFLLMKIKFLLIISILELMRIIINLIPLFNSDGYKCMMIFKTKK